MIWILLSLLLAVPVSVWAGEPTKIGDSSNECLMWLDKDNGIQVEGKGCQPYLQKSGCYRRMQEAMAAMSRGRVDHGEKNLDMWIVTRMSRLEQKQRNATMEECVK